MDHQLLAPSTPEWEIAFFSTVLPEIISSLAQQAPGLANSIFDSLEEDEILEVFTDCCNKMNVSICESEDAGFRLTDNNGVDKRIDFIRVFRRAIERRMESNIGVETIGL